MNKHIYIIQLIRIKSSISQFQINNNITASNQVILTIGLLSFLFQLWETELVLS